MAKRVVREEKVFADPYESVRGTVNDPAREHDPGLIRNTPEVGRPTVRTPTLVVDAPAPVLSPTTPGTRRKRRKQSS